ncbi:DnaJ-like protein subfamily C member 24 [Elysia marginata]|uniref:DnaJ-like protein subfamily C member 24 n=1 Tax=Elysia marginata TaxID=1093978 RepID=A0AAV4IXU3_9GAST|nr:DnaJ-like protein subfamily C member 24 [Elysia marginata]
MEDLYEILQCPSTASKAELRRAYTRLARTHHPDKQTQREAAVNSAISVSRLLEGSNDCRPPHGASNCCLQVSSLSEPSNNHLLSPCNPCEKSETVSLPHEENNKCISESDDSAMKHKVSDYDFVKIDKAWKILGDDDLRAQYDIMWQDRCLMQEHPVQETVPFDEFQFDVDEDFFTYPCRCGGEYLLTELERQLMCDFVCCDTCSLIIKIIYDVT